MVLRYEDLADEPTDLHKPSRKRKQVAFGAQKILQKPHKKKVVQQKEIEKEIEELVEPTILKPYKTRSGNTPQKLSSFYITTDAPVKKRKLRNIILPYKIAEEEEEEEVEVSLVKRTKFVGVGAKKFVE